MKIYLCRMIGDKRRMQKTILNGIELDGTLRGESSVTNPIITVAGEIGDGWNYARIPAFDNRYYYITDRRALKNGLYEISMHVDVLMSWGSQILSCPAIVDKQERPGVGNAYIDDNSAITSTLRTNQVLKFSAGFADRPYYILATAGGGAGGNNNE